MLNEYYSVMVRPFFVWKNCLKNLFLVFVFCVIWFEFIFLAFFFGEKKVGSDRKDVEISRAVKGSTKLSMAKKVFDGKVATSIIAGKGSGFNNNGKIRNLWKRHGCFQQQPCQFQLEKVNIPEMTILYLNQVYLSYKDKRKIYYCDFFIIGQVIPALNSPESWSIMNLSQTIPK